VVALAQHQACASISYTYTEPTIFFEYAFDIAKAAAAVGIRNVFVTNGYITPEPLHMLAPYLDAANIDLKFFRDETYHRVCNARLAPVLDTIKLYRALGIWIEITTLVIPGYNDSTDELRAIAEFLAALDTRIPWHVSAFHPAYKLNDTDATPVATLLRAREIGQVAGLKHVYTGNVDDAAGSRTHCAGCGAPLIERRGFRVLGNRIERGACPNCQQPLDGVWA
jgi:pyruvate formate lyase activating enzyme